MHYTHTEKEGERENTQIILLIRKVWRPLSLIIDGLI